MTRLLRRFPLAAALILAVALVQPACAADFFKWLKRDTTAQESVWGTLSEDEIVQGLKEALARGSEHAVTNLGRLDGYWGHEDVRILMPKSLRSVESTLRKLKQDALADRFVQTMNRAAEQAVPEAASLLGDAIRKMTLADAKSILTGPDDAATVYFRKTSEERLREKMLPIVRKTTAETGVTATYKTILETTGPATTFLGLSRREVDLDAYVTDQALGGLFKRMAEEEKLIRQNPAARTTDLIRKIFAPADSAR